MSESPRRTRSALFFVRVPPRDSVGLGPLFWPRRDFSAAAPCRSQNIFVGPRGAPAELLVAHPEHSLIVLFRPWNGVSFFLLANIVRPRNRRRRFFSCSLLICVQSFEYTAVAASLCTHRRVPHDTPRSSRSSPSPPLLHPLPFPPLFTFRPRPRRLPAPRSAKSSGNTTLRIRPRITVFCSFRRVRRHRLPVPVSLSVCCFCPFAGFVGSAGFAQLAVPVSADSSLSRRSR